MSHSHPAGLLAAYNSLTDKHLAGYFNNTRIRRHLLRSGLITRSGRILSEKEYKLNIMKRDHQKYIRECLAQAIFHKVLDMERYHQLEVKKKLETLAKKERIQRLKGDHTRRYIENNMPILSPHPPVGPKTTRGHSVLVDEGPSSPLTLTAPRPYTAPGNMQPPIRLQPLPNNSAVGRVTKITLGSRSKTSLLENEAPFPIGGKKAMMKFRNSMNNSQRMNPYQLPNINGYMMPIPPLAPPPDGKITRENRSETWRRRRFRSTTAPNGLEPLFTRDSGRIYKTSLHSNAAITMIYLGKNVHLSYDNTDFRDEIKVYQQHCGGENLCVYKGKLLEKETFQFISKRHHGFPFSLTFFLNGMQVNRLSSCCEYKHRKGSRLGGKRGYFGFVCVERASPCYKCIIAMGLDKKPRKDKSTDKKEEQRKDERKVKKDRENVIPRRNESEENKFSVSASFSAEEIKMGVGEVRTAMEEMNCKEYEEDFEVDEEKQDEKANEEGQAADQMNGISKSPSEDEKDDLGSEKESEILSQKAPDANDNVKDEDDECSESESEEDKQDIKTASSTSSGSNPYSSDSEDDSSDSDREAQAEISTSESTRSASSQELSENDEPDKSHLPIEESLEVGIKDQETEKADMETKPQPHQESLENGLEKEMEKGTQVVPENLSEKSEKLASKEDEERDKSKLWEENSAEVQDKVAGLPGVEDGVGQIISEALAPGCHSHYDTKPGAGGTAEGGKPTRKLESDTGGAPSRNSVVEERAALISNTESEHVAPETRTMEKKGATEEGRALQGEDTELPEGKGGAEWKGKARGVKEAPLGERKPAAEQPTSEQVTEESEVPGARASRSEAEAKGESRSSTEEVSPMGMAARRGSGGLSREEDPAEQALMQGMLETETTVLGGEESWEKAALKNNRALSTEPLQEAAAAREAVTPKKWAAEGAEAVSEAGSQGPGVGESEQGAPAELEDMGPLQGEAPQREAIRGGEGPATEAKEDLEAELPCSFWTEEVEHATEKKDFVDGEAPRSSSRRQAEGRQLHELCKQGPAREEIGTEAEINRNGYSKETLPEEFHAAQAGWEAERPETQLRENIFKTEETRANTWKDGDALGEEQRLSREEGETVKEVRSEEQTRAPENERESDREDTEPTEATESNEDTELLEDSMETREVTLVEAIPGFEKSPGKEASLRKEGEKSLSEGGRAELLGQERVAAEEQAFGPHHAGAPADEPAGQAQTAEGTCPATGEAEKPAGEDQDCLEAQRPDVEEALPEPGGAQVMPRTKKDVPEGGPQTTEKFSEDAVNEDTGEEEKECIPGTRVTVHTSSEGAGALGGTAIVAEGDTHGSGGGSAETVPEREVLADSKTAQGKTMSNKACSGSDVAGEEAWPEEDKALGKTTAAERVAAEETGLSKEEIPSEEVTVTLTGEATVVGSQPESFSVEGEAPRLGQDQEGGEAQATPCVGSAGEEAGTGRSDDGQESKASEEFLGGSLQGRESGLSRGSLEVLVATFPSRPDSPATQEKQEHLVQRDHERAHIPLNHEEH